MMRQTRQFQQHRQTKTQNRLAFTMWLNCCTDDALARADSMSLGRSYGLEPNFVVSEIAKETGKRRNTKPIGARA